MFNLGSGGGGVGRDPGSHAALAGSSAMGGTVFCINSCQRMAGVIDNYSIRNHSHVQLLFNKALLQSTEARPSASGLTCPQQKAWSQTQNQLVSFMLQSELQGEQQQQQET